MTPLELAAGDEGPGPGPEGWPASRMCFASPCPHALYLLGRTDDNDRSLHYCYATGILHEQLQEFPQPKSC